MCVSSKGGGEEAYKRVWLFINGISPSLYQIFWSVIFKGVSYGSDELKRNHKMTGHSLARFVFLECILRLLMTTD